MAHLHLCHRIAAEDHGIPERVMLSYLQGEIEGETAVKNLPATKLQLTILISFLAADSALTSKDTGPKAAILLIVWFLMMCLAQKNGDRKCHRAWLRGVSVVYR